jgi:SAM-dependent methyltransferase
MMRFSKSVTWLRDYGADAWIYRELIKAHSPIARLGLELGVGSGLLATRLASSFDCLIGLDHDPSTLSHAHSAYRLLIASASSLPIRSNCIDVVYAPFGFVTNFMTEDELIRLLSAISRVLRPGGITLMNGFDSQRVHGIYGNACYRPYDPYGRLRGIRAEVFTEVQDNERIELDFRLWNPDEHCLHFSLKGWSPEALVRIASPLGLSHLRTSDASRVEPYESDSEEYIVVMERTGR